jgi:glycerol-3-phosphate acyltransferase PlsX
MATSLHVAVDVVGGDHFPKNPIAGAKLALETHSHLTLHLLGPEPLIKEEAQSQELDLSRCVIHDAPDIIGMEESPSAALKTKPDSSIALGNGLVKKKHAQAFVSAGNTGALLAASMFILGKLDGVARPTICTVYPSKKGFRLLLDAGANLDLRPEHYVQFAKMGRIYARHLMEIDHPKIGLLNVGEEAEKGTEVLVEAYKVLQNLPEFVGNIEGRDILTGKADVFLCNGLVGNLLLKFGESIPDVLYELLAKTMKEKHLEPAQQALVAEVFKDALQPFNYENVGGMPFLGVDGISMVGHGGSTPKAIFNMISNAMHCVEVELNQRILTSLN